MAKVPEKKKVEVSKGEVSTKTDKVSENKVDPKVEEKPKVDPKVEEEAKKPTEKTEKPEASTEQPVNKTEPVAVERKISTYGEVKNVDIAMVQYIDRYNDILKRNSIAMSIKALSNIFAYVLSKPTNANLECLYVWFSNPDYQNSILAESVIFQGINKVGIKIRSKMEVMYIIFRELTTTKRNVSLEKAREYLPEEIITWIAKKRKSK
jgi:hypothetical protein